DHADHADHNQASHSDIVAKYQFQCADVKAVKALTLELFQVYPAIETVQAEAVMQSGQYFQRLVAAAKRWNLE
ncbi:MAG: DUF2796 domain-containing protein, partial [Pseudomonadales bacterium]|nr:DUF2796 domain-containing protein [Pseudomonadales bacterium]